MYNPTGNNKAFLEYLKERMIFDKPSSDDLKKMLNEKISRIDSLEERIEILREIIKLWQAREINRFDIGRVTDFKNYVEYILAKEEVGKVSVKAVKTIKVQKVEPFDYLFLSGDKKQLASETAKKVLKSFTDNDYLISGKWNCPGGDYKTIAIPFYILRDYFGLITPGRQTGKLLKIWCVGLGIEPGRSFIRNCEKNPEEGKRPTIDYQRKRGEFYKLFEYYFTPIKDLIPLETNKSKKS